MNVSKTLRKRKATQKKTKRENKTTITVRIPPGIKDYVDAIARDSSTHPATLYRNIFYAGIKALYCVEIRDHKIIGSNNQPPIG